MTAMQYKKTGKRKSPERTVQISIVKWLREVMPKAIVQQTRNETHKRGQAGAIAGGMNKMMGAWTGFPDLIVLPFANVGPFFLEVKAEGGRTSEAQKECHIRLKNLGYPVAVVRSVDDVREFLQETGIGFQEGF